MTATIEHRPAEAHQRTHGPDYECPTAVHGDYVDYVHNGRAYYEDNGHHDEYDTCSCEHCSGSCAVCEHGGYFRPIYNRNACSCKHCSDSCSPCTCEDCSYPTCTHAA